MSVCAHSQLNQYPSDCSILGLQSRRQSVTKRVRQSGAGRNESGRWWRVGRGGWIKTRASMLPARTGNRSNPILEKVVKHSTVVSRQADGRPGQQMHYHSTCPHPVRACVCCGQTAEWLWARQPLHWREVILCALTGRLNKAPPGSRAPIESPLATQQQGSQLLLRLACPGSATTREGPRPNQWPAPRLSDAPGRASRVP